MSISFFYKNINPTKINYFNVQIMLFHFILIIINISLIATNENILVLNSSHYRAGSPAFTSNGDLIIEYSYKNYRLFYGLHKNWKNYFGKSSTKVITINDERYESENIFISLNNTNNNKEYLFSIGKYHPNAKPKIITELHDLETNKTITKDTFEFLNYIEFSLSFSLFSIPESKTYLMTYVPDNPSSCCVLQLFSFSDFSLDNNKIKSVIINNLLQNIFSINSFIMNDNIILFYISNITLSYQINIYDFNLDLKAENIFISNTGYNDHNSKIFYKGLHIMDNITAFMYFTKNETESYILNLNVGYLENKKKFLSYLNFSFDKNLITRSRINSFIKLNNNRLSYIGVVAENISKFCIILFDLYNTFQNMKIRVFYYDIKYYDIDEEFDGILYNNYLFITSTVINKGETNKYSNDLKYSIILIFGYVNGTDEYINIYKYINENIDNENNLISDLVEKAKIDNNIFGYEILKDRIKLEYIPEQLELYNKNISNNISLKSGDILYNNYLLKIEKKFDNSNNYLEYQIMLMEADYDTLNNYSSDIINYSMENIEFIEEKNFYNRSILYGRTNTLTFMSQSCHEYCLICSELGNSDNNQKCIKCKDEYSYFHEDDFESNCIPEGKFYDGEINQLIECNNSNSKFYIEENGKKICFKNTKNCPSDHQYLNNITNECIKLKIENSEKTFNNNEDIYYNIMEILKNYDAKNETSIYINPQPNVIFEITTIEKEKKELNEMIQKDNLSIIDMAQCETILRNNYNITDKNISLIILKSENLNSIPCEKNVQFEIYESINKTKLNLSYCDKTQINYFFHLELNSDTKKIYEDLNNLGHDLFNIKDSFYQDICTPYKTENNTDILLSDRINDIFNKNKNLTLCQENCEYSEYNKDKKLLKCKCSISDESIDYKDQKKFTPKKIYESFYEVLKYSNYKIFKCYKLIFLTDSISSNYGSIICFILFGVYFIFLIIYICKGISPLKINIMRLKENIKESNGLNQKSHINNINDKIIFQNNRKLFKNKTNKKIINNYFFPKNNINRNKTIKIINSRNKSITQNIIKKSVSIVNQNYFILNKSEGKELIDISKKHSNLTEKKNNLDDFELNDLDYLKAKKLDKRTFWAIYLSIIKREHLIIFTFCIRDDYNLYYIKFMKFIFFTCTDMAMNVLFFSDESMHKIYLNYGKYDFFQQIPQTVYSIVVSQIFEVFLCFLSLTDKYYYQIKNNYKDRQKNKTGNFEMLKILKSVNVKLFCFSIFTFIFLVLYWYLITCFCAVYKNTQYIFIKDFLISYIMGLIYPFILYLIPPFLRIIALRACNKANLSFVYKLSDIIPIF